MYIFRMHSRIREEGLSFVISEFQTIEIQILSLSRETCNSEIMKYEIFLFLVACSITIRATCRNAWRSRRSWDWDLGSGIERFQFQSTIISVTCVHVCGCVCVSLCVHASVCDRLDHCCRRYTPSDGTSASRFSYRGRCLGCAAGTCSSADTL